MLQLPDTKFFKKSNHAKDKLTWISTPPSGQRTEKLIGGFSAASNFTALIPSRSIRLMSANFSGLHSGRLYWSLGNFKEKGSRCLVFSSSYKTWNRALSRRSRAAMAKIRMKKKRYKRAKLFFTNNLKPIIFCRSSFRRCRLLRGSQWG